MTSFPSSSAFPSLNSLPFSISLSFRRLPFCILVRADRIEPADVRSSGQRKFSLSGFKSYQEILPRFLWRGCLKGGILKFA